MPPSIDVISDVVCPWCFIGKRRLERALEMLAAEGAVPNVTWRPFQLNPDLPEAGVERQAYIETKFGGSLSAERVYARVAAVGEEVGIAFDFNRIARQPNTINAHRLIAYAQRQGKQDALVERLFEAFFLEGHDIHSPAALAKLAGDAGMSEAEVEAYLRGEEDLDTTKAEDDWARGAGVSGVPFFIFNGKIAVSGAHEAETLVKAYRESLAQI
jgi:predicted DsbA family dithiol-disulfide isomerase